MEYIPYVKAFGVFSYLFSNNSCIIDDKSLDDKSLDDKSLDDKSLDDKCNSIDFELINEELGDSFREKKEAITKICKEECNLKMKIYSKKKHYNKLKKYIYEYETKGHREFVKNHYQSLS